MQLVRRNSLTARLTLLFALASSAVLLALGLVVSSLVEKHFEEQDMEVLTGKLALTRNALSKIHDATALGGLAQTLDDSLVGHTGMSIAVVDPHDEVIFASSGGAFPGPLLEGRHASLVPRVWESSGIPFRGISALLPSGVAGWPALFVAVSMDISHHRMFMRSFSHALWMFVVGAAVLTGLLGWVVAYRGLLPLRSMRDRVARVTAQQLDQRLPVESVPGELAELAHTLNDMLGRLEEAFRRISDFSSDIAHELRTPVSNLMTQTQVALSRPRSAEEYRAVLESSAEECERLARMIADMLFLAKADHGLVTPNRETVELAREVGELFDFYEALAAERHIRLASRGEAAVAGDRLMLRRALGNLLANAIEHAAAQSVVEVALDEAGTNVAIIVRNRGNTIPAEHLPRLFDRFYRVDPARRRQGEGAGLGLAITRSIVQAHGGSVEVGSAAGVTEFRVLLPR